MNAVIPTCLALVFCDRVGRVPRSGNASLIGVFHILLGSSFPMITRPFNAWIQFTQGNGHVHMQLVIERLLPDQPESETRLVIRFSLVFDDPNDVLEHVIDFGNGIDIPCEGSYRARLVADGVTIMTRPFLVTAN